jgi:hypothetical protein
MTPTPRSRVPDASIGPGRVRRAELPSHLAHVLRHGRGVKGMGTDRTRLARNVVAEVVPLWQRLWGVPAPPGASTRPISSPTGIAAALPGMPLTVAVVGDFGRCHELDAECEAEKAVARLVTSWASDYVLTTGPNNYRAGVSATMAPNLQPYRGYIEPTRRACPSAVPKPVRPGRDALGPLGAVHHRRWLCRTASLT